MRGRIPTRRISAGERHLYEDALGYNHCSLRHFAGRDCWGYSARYLFVPLASTGSDSQRHPRVGHPRVGHPRVGHPPLSCPYQFPKMRPQLRPASPQEIAAAARATDVPLLGPDVSMRPYLRPKELEQQVLFKKRKLRKSSVCGDIDIQGKAMGRVPGRIQACGIKDAVQITSVSGVKLSRPSMMDCGTAQGAEQMGG